MTPGTSSVLYALGAHSPSFSVSKRFSLSHLSVPLRGSASPPVCESKCPVRRREVRERTKGKEFGSKERGRDRWMER